MKLSRGIVLRYWLLCVLLSSNNNGGSSGVYAFAPVAISRPARRMTATSFSALPAFEEGDEENEIMDSSSDTSNLFTKAASSKTGLEAFCGFIRNGVRNLAKLSLEDYKWRSSVFKANEADRRVEESLARMLGEEASYVRPMDAGEEKIGPLGRAEKMAVGWLSQVIEEEGRRAERIVNSADGDVLVRPMDLASSDEELGPLAFLEKQAVEFFARIREAEKERVGTGVLRPKDLDETKRGPLGEAEAKAVSALSEIKNSEKLRMEQSRLRGGEVVRPIDVPGPIGEIEMKFLEIFDAEKERKKDRENNEGRLVRPKDAIVQRPLGKAEKQAMSAVERLQQEERERFRNIWRVMEENRPMELDRLSPLGILEAIVVGIIRAPQLILQVVQRVKELMSSEQLEPEDEKIVQEEQFRLRLPTLDDKDTNDPFS